MENVCLCDFMPHNLQTCKVSINFVSAWAAVVKKSRFFSWAVGSTGALRVIIDSDVCDLINIMIMRSIIIKKKTVDQVL